MLRPCANISAAPFFMLVVQVVAVDVGLQLVGREHHHHIGPFGGVGDFHDLELLGLGLLHAGRALAQRDRDVLDAGIPQVQGMGMALAAIADDGDFLALDEVYVGITVVINTHGSFPYLNLFSVVAPGLMPDIQVFERHMPDVEGRDKPGQNVRNYIPSAPRVIATMPLRETSISPTGSRAAIQRSILSVEPLISKTKLSVVSSTTRASKSLAMRNASARWSPLPAHFDHARARARSPAPPA